MDGWPNFVRCGAPLTRALTWSSAIRWTLSPKGDCLRKSGLYYGKCTNGEFNTEESALYKRFSVWDQHSFRPQWRGKGFPYSREPHKSKMQQTLHFKRIQSLDAELYDDIFRCELARTWSHDRSPLLLKWLARLNRLFQTSCFFHLYASMSLNPMISVQKNNRNYSSNISRRQTPVARVTLTWR